MSAKLNLNWQELLWLAEGAMGKSHLRWNIYDMFVDVIYPQLNDKERDNVYTYLKRDTRWLWEYKHRDDTAYQYWLQVLARYNPTNQYGVLLKDKDGKEKTADAYLWNGRYYVGWKRFCNEEFIVSVEQKMYRGCMNDYCGAKDICKRYYDDETEGRMILDGIKKWPCKNCDFLITGNDEVEQKD